MKREWTVGCNFLPSTAVNDVEMWQAESFDPETIARELGWAEGLGLNGVRVFLNYVVWEAEPDGLLERLDLFLGIAQRHGMQVMPVLFDDCAFSGKEPRAGKQAEPVAGVHNSQWVPSPSHARVEDEAAWAKLRRYVEAIVGGLGDDGRIVAWDLYNEPGNDGMGERSMPLVEAAFGWARATGAEQPLTVGAWADFGSAMSRRMMELSDVVSFHAYDPPAGVEAKIELCRKYGKPLACTEWLHRQSGNTVEAVLPVFEREGVDCYCWGCVAGRTQTYMPWGSKAGDPRPEVWQHDLFHPDGTPYSESETKAFRAAQDKRGPDGS